LALAVLFVFFFDGSEAFEVAPFRSKHHQGGRGGGKVERWVRGGGGGGGKQMRLVLNLRAEEACTKMSITSRKV